MEPEPNTFTGKFKGGDIVFVRAYPWNIESPIPEDTIGVISHTPINYEDWVSKGNDKYEWDNSYVVNFIRDGYLGHMHVTEKNLKQFDQEIPNNLSFIDHLSRHLKGQTVIEETVLRDIFNGEIFVENVRYFYETDIVKTNQ